MCANPDAGLSFVVVVADPDLIETDVELLRRAEQRARLAEQPLHQPPRVPAAAVVPATVAGRPVAVGALAAAGTSIERRRERERELIERVPAASACDAPH